MKSPMKFRLLLACMLFLGLIGPAAITYPAAPEGGKEAALQSLSHALKPFRVDRVEDLAISAPCQIYRVELTNLAAGDLVSAAHPGYACGWECLVLKGPKAGGLCFLWADRVTGKVTNCLAVADEVAGKWQAAISVAEQVPVVKQRDYAIRFVDVGLPQFRAVWLHGRSEDIFIPLYDDRGGRLKALQTYTEKELIRVWQPMA